MICTTLSPIILLNALAYEGKCSICPFHYAIYLYHYFQGAMDLHPNVSLDINTPKVPVIILYVLA